MSNILGECLRAKVRLEDYASANESQLSCSCGDCAQCAASYMTPEEALWILGLIGRLQSDMSRLHEALWEIGSYKLAQFAGAHDMALACVHKASTKLSDFHGGDK